MTNPNTAEEIAKIIFQLGKLHERGEIDYDLSKSVELIEEHSQSQLQELREKAEQRKEDIQGIVDEAGYPDVYLAIKESRIDEIETVLNLIDQLED